MADTVVIDEGNVTAWTRRDYSGTRQTELEDDLLFRTRVYDAIASYKMELPSANPQYQLWLDAVRIAGERLTELAFKYVATHRGHYLDGKGRGHDND